MSKQHRGTLLLRRRSSLLKLRMDEWVWRKIVKTSVRVYIYTIYIYTNKSDIIYIYGVKKQDSIDSGKTTVVDPRMTSVQPSIPWIFDCTSCYFIQILTLLLISWLITINIHTRGDLVGCSYSEMSGLYLHRIDWSKVRVQRK